MSEPEIIPWPTDAGIWMGLEEQLVVWFPFLTMELKDDLPTREQIEMERRDPENAPPRKVLAIVAQWPAREDYWPYTFQGCHPVEKWRRPTAEELARARHFYGLDKTP